MKKYLILFGLLLAFAVHRAEATTVYCSVGANAMSPVCPAVTTSGTVIQVPNAPLTFNATFEEIFSGSPSTVSVTIVGCNKGGTCSSTLNTNTTTSATVQYANSMTVAYTYYQVTVTWTGGTNVSFQLNPVLSTARNGGGGSSGVTSFNSRTGAVSPASGDYTCAEVTNCGTGTITGVTAGTNATGGGTSGNVTVGVANSPSFSGSVTAASGITSTSDGVHAGELSLVGNTTNPTIPANAFGWIGPALASFTSYFLQPSSAAPSGTQYLACSTPSSNVSSCPWTSAPGSIGYNSGSISASVGATNIASAANFPTGQYLLSCDVVVTAVGSSPTLATTVGWTDISGTARTKTCTTGVVLISDNPFTTSITSNGSAAITITQTLAVSTATWQTTVAITRLQ